MIAELRRRLPELPLLTEPADVAPYAKDWTNFITPNALGVALPRTTDEVSALVKVCAELNLPIVPSGGRTGLAGGAVASRRELVVSLSKLTHIGDVDTTTRTVRVGAGAVNEQVQEAVASSGLFWPVELGSKGSCTVGGNIATNAGGVRVIRYGHARQWVQSLEVVFADGTVAELNGDLEKNNTGYDLRHLVIGSEGTLALVTAATLKLAPKPKDRRTLFFGVASLESVLQLLGSAREAGWPLLAFECLTRACLESVCAGRGWRDPLGTSAPFYALIDIEETAEVSGAQLDAWIESVHSSGLILDGTLASDAAEARRLWGYREGITESLANRGLVYKNDLALPIRALGEFAAELVALAPKIYPGCEIFYFGHIGDGNLHVNVLKPAAMDAGAFTKLCEDANRPLFSIVKRLKGSIAAEHGIGLLKKAFLDYSRSPEEIRFFRGMKRVFDPQGLLNPGKIFDLE